MASQRDQSNLHNVNADEFQVLSESLATEWLDSTMTDLPQSAVDIDSAASSSFLFDEYAMPTSPWMNEFLEDIFEDELFLTRQSTSPSFPVPETPDSQCTTEGSCMPATPQTLSASPYFSSYQATGSIWAASSPIQEDALGLAKASPSPKEASNTKKRKRSSVTRSLPRKSSKASVPSVTPSWKEGSGCFRLNVTRKKETSITNPRNKACIRCSWLKKRCDGVTPCKECLKVAGKAQSIWKQPCAPALLPSSAIFEMTISLQVKLFKSAIRGVDLQADGPFGLSYTPLDGRFEDNEQRGLDYEFASYHRGLIRAIKRRAFAKASDLEIEELESLLAELHVTTLALDALFTSLIEESCQSDDTDERKVGVLEFLREISMWHSAASRHADLGTQIFKLTHGRLGLFRDGKLTQEQGVHLVRTLYTLIGNLQLLVYFNGLISHMVENEEQKRSQALRTRHAQQAGLIYSVYADQIKERLSHTFKLASGNTLALGLFPIIDKSQVQETPPLAPGRTWTSESKIVTGRFSVWTGYNIF